jgi:hypothetical protein
MFHCSSFMLIMFSMYVLGMTLGRPIRKKILIRRAEKRYKYLYFCYLIQLWTDYSYIVLCFTIEFRLQRKVVRSGNL